MKEWPEDKTKPISFDEAVEPFIKILKDYIIGELKGPVDTTECYNIGLRERASSFDTEFALSPEGLKYHKEHDRGLVDVVLGLVFQLGIEQGRRVQNEDLKIWINIGQRVLKSDDLNLETMKHCLDRLVNR